MIILLKIIILNVLTVSYLTITLENRLHFAGKMKYKNKNTESLCSHTNSTSLFKVGNSTDTNDSNQPVTQITNQEVTRTLDDGVSTVTTIANSIPALLSQIEDILEDTLHNITTITSGNPILSNLTQTVNNSLNQILNNSAIQSVTNVVNNNTNTGKNQCASCNCKNNIGNLTNADLSNISPKMIAMFIEFYRSERLKYKKKTEICNDFNIQNCVNFCGEYEVTHCEQSISCQPERLFRCKCGGRVSYWHYHSHGKNFGIPGKTLLNSILFLHKRRILSDNLNRNSNCFTNKILNEICLSNEDKALVEELNNLEVLSQLEKLLLLNSNKCEMSNLNNDLTNIPLIQQILKKISLYNSGECSSNYLQQLNCGCSNEENSCLINSVSQLLNTSGIQNLLNSLNNTKNQVTNSTGTNGIVDAVTDSANGVVNNVINS